MAWVKREVYAAAEALAVRLDSESVDPEDLECQSKPHPEGAKRGGYVPVYSEGKARVFYCTTAEEWVPYDDEEDDDED